MPGSNDDEKVDQQMKVYVTKSEKITLVDMADTIGISFSSFARSVLLDYEIEANLVEVRKLRYEVNKIGVNVNQMSRVANRQGELPAAQELSKLKRQMVKVLEQL